MELCMEQILCCNQQLIIVTMVMLLQKFGSHLTEKFKGFLFLHNVLQWLWVLMLVLLHFVLLCKIHAFGIGKGKMAVDEVFQLTSTAKLRLLKWYGLWFRLWNSVFLQNFIFMASFDKSQWYVLTCVLSAL